MARIIHIAGLERWLRDEPDKLLKIGEAACYSAARGSVGLIQKTIDAVRPHPPVDTGAYRRSWRARKVDGGADLFNTMPYAMDIEIGRPPNTPDPVKILAWARRKKRHIPVAVREPAAIGLAIGATRAIQLRGNRAYMILEKTADAMEELLELELRRKLSRYLT